MPSFFIIPAQRGLDLRGVKAVGQGPQRYGNFSRACINVPSTPGTLSRLVGQLKYDPVRAVELARPEVERVVIANYAHSAPDATTSQVVPLYVSSHHCPAASVLSDAPTMTLNAPIAAAVRVTRSTSPASGYPESDTARSAVIGDL